MPDAGRTAAGPTVAGSGLSVGERAEIGQSRAEIGVIVVLLLAVLVLIEPLGSRPPGRPAIR